MFVAGPLAGPQSSGVWADTARAYEKPVESKENPMTDVPRSHGPKHGPGTTQRPQRVREFLHLKALEIMRADSELSEAEAHRQAYQELQQVLSNGGQELLRKVEQLAPILTAPDRRSIHRMVEIAAITRVPSMRWLAEQLERYAESGPHADYSCAIAALLAMASGASRPRIRAARQMFDGNALAGFAFGHPVAKPESSVYDNVKGIYQRTPPELTCIVNVELIRRLAQGQPDRPGRLPTRIGEVGVVDGTDIPGHFQQRKPIDRIMRALLIGSQAPRADYVRYVDEDGQAFKRWTGYKLVLISDLASTLPLIWGMFPAGVDERQAAASLLELLFELWPDCPMIYLVGDADYDHAEQFHVALESRWSIHPVFSPHGERMKSGRSTPICKHGPMIFRHTDGYPTLPRRIKEGIPRGIPMDITAARRRWQCSAGRCDDVTQRFLDDPRGHSFLPRHGDSSMSQLRTALLLRRNGVESVNAQLKHLGIGGTRQNKLRTKCETTLDWLIQLGLLTITATRYIHHTGLYEPTHEVAEQLDLLRYATPASPNPGPDPLQLKMAEAELERIFGPPETPESVLREGSALDEPDTLAA
jgi:hypothetical protein